MLPSLTEGVDVEEANIGVGERSRRRPGDIDEARSGLIGEGKGFDSGDVRIVEEGNVISAGLVVDGLLGVLLPEHVVKKTFVESQGGDPQCCAVVGALSGRARARVVPWQDRRPFGAPWCSPR